MADDYDSKVVQTISDEDLQKLHDEEERRLIELTGSDKAKSITESNIEAFHLALHMILRERSNLSSTTNLTQKKANAITHLQVLNHYFRCTAIDIFVTTTYETQRSVTTNPRSMLNMISDMVSSYRQNDSPRGLRGLINRRS